MTTLPSSEPAPAIVAEAFAHYAQSIAAKEGVALPDLRYRAADRGELPDGGMATLWVGTAEHARSRCFFVDVSAPDGQRATGTGACGAPGDCLSLGRAGSIVVGSVGEHPAETVRVTTRHGTATLCVAGGYFLVPPRLTPDGDVLHTVVLIGIDGDVLGEVTDVSAPGGAVPTG